jgi:acetyl esterase/lipase
MDDGFDPGLRRVARVLPRSAVSGRSLPLVRTLTKILGVVATGDVTVEPVGAISVRLHGQVSSERPRPALLWIHGGGFVIGSAAQDDSIGRRLADRLGIVVAAPEYRLAPEHPFPVPLEDCYEALTWLARQAYVDPARIAVGGASAGGGLAAALAVLARDRGELQLAFQLLSYPMLDDRTVLRTDIDERRFRLWNNKANRFGWQSYTGYPPGSDQVSAGAAPARTDDLSGLPPAWLGVGTLDLFHDEGIAYADRLVRAGVDCDLDVVEGAFHGFDSIRPNAAVSRAYRSAQTSALGAALR